MENKKEGLMQVLDGTGVNSDNKIVKWATYAVLNLVING